ncbi:MAG: MGMT family protein [Pyrinomonadaceae bacterium]
MSIVNEKQYRERVYAIVRQIPPGRVMTYGQIAMILGEGYTARTVGYVMHGAGDEVPWQRVINSQGKCSTGRLTLPHNLQQEILESEGIEFTKSGKCDLNKYRWYPDGLEPEDEIHPSLLS